MQHNKSLLTKTLKPKKSIRGYGLIEALISIVILSFGILGIAQFQVVTLAKSTDNQARLQAIATADELLTMMKLDAPNSTCYTMPSAGGCASQTASTYLGTVTSQLSSTLPGFQSLTSTINGNTVNVTIKWTSKAYKDTRSYTMVSDLRSNN